MQGGDAVHTKTEELPLATVKTHKNFCISKTTL